MHPNSAALIAAFFFGIIVFPWDRAVERIGTGAVFFTIGIVYVIFGAAYHLLGPAGEPLRPVDAGYGALVALVDLCAVAAFSYAVSHPAKHMPVIGALVASAPLFTLAVAIVFIRQPISFKEGAFVVLTVVGLVGMSLTSRT